MAWPFQSVSAPTFESGDGLIAVPDSSTAVPNAGGGKVWLLGLWIINTTDAKRTFQLFDGNDDPATPIVEVPAGGWMPIEVPFLPLTGLKWAADDTGVRAKAWGYK